MLICDMQVNTFFGLPAIALVIQDIAFYRKPLNEYFI